MKDLLGLHSAKKILENAQFIESGVHAILFYGPEGCGKTALVEHLAKAWFCSSNLLDCLWIKPQPPSMIIRLEAIFSVKEFLRSAPIVAQQKVVVFEQADRMTPETANALLKTLEEPERYVKFILTTSNLSKVLPTIRSRCLSIACELPKFEELEMALGSLSLPERIFSEGAPGRVLKIREHASLYHQLYEFFERIPIDLPRGALKYAEELKKISSEFEKEMNCSMRVGQSEVLHCLALWGIQRGFLTPDQVKKITEAHRRILGNANAAFVFDSIFVNF